MFSNATILQASVFSIPVEDRGRFYVLCNNIWERFSCVKLRTGGVKTSPVSIEMRGTSETENRSVFHWEIK